MFRTKILIPLIITVLTSGAMSQTAPVRREQSRPIQKHDPFYAEVIESLEPTNPLRVVLEGGMRGHGPHYFWMDEMKDRRIKQVHFEVAFLWYKNVARVKVTKLLYMRSYFAMLQPIGDKQFLDEITGSDLELQVKAEAEARAYDAVKALMAEPPVARTGCGIVFQDLFDDERLPLISSQLPEIGHTCRDGLK